MLLNVACVVTLINLSCGFFAITLQLAGMNRIGLMMLLISFVGDGLDGYLARKTKSTSAFGERLDSLSDVIAFGVAPAFFALGIHPEWKMDYVAVLFLMLYVICGALRLARYDPTIQKHSFQGMPIPAAGLLLTALSITSDSNPLFHLAPLALGLLMVSDVPFMKLSFTGPKRMLPIMCAIAFLVTLAASRDLAVATLGFTVPYLFVNLGLAAGREMQGRRDGSSHGRLTALGVTQLRKGHKLMHLLEEMKANGQTEFEMPNCGRKGLQYRTINIDEAISSVKRREWGAWGQMGASSVLMAAGCLGFAPLAAAGMIASTAVGLAAVGAEVYVHRQEIGEKLKETAVRVKNKVVDLADVRRRSAIDTARDPVELAG